MQNKEIVKIISLADKSGFRNIDTAVLYGEAEKTLGKIGVKNFKITSKLPYISSLEIKNIEKIIQRSLKNLRIKSLYCLLIHDSKNINKIINIKNDKIKQSLLELNKIFKTR